MNAYLKAMGITEWVRRDAVSYSEQMIEKIEQHQEVIEVKPEIPEIKNIQENQPVITQVLPVQEIDNSREKFILNLDWTNLEQRIKSCTDCPLHQERTNTVFGVGSKQAKWLILGEAPGQEEDKQGEPFVGRAGQLLNSMLFAVGLQRSDIFIANTVKCRPPNNRDPHPTEILSCAPFLSRQIELLKPSLILILGRVAVRRLLQKEDALGKLRGKVHEYQNIPVVITYHPAYLLRSPSEKAKAWEDLQFALSVGSPV
jgi:uracil-DNA glycosylase